MKPWSTLTRLQNGRKTRTTSHGLYETFMKTLNTVEALEEDWVLKIDWKKEFKDHKGLSEEVKTKLLAAFISAQKVYDRPDQTSAKWAKSASP